MFKVVVSMNGETESQTIKHGKHKPAQDIKRDSPPKKISYNTQIWGMK